MTIAGDPSALAAIDQALALEPLSALLYGVRGNILLRADRPLAALEAYERVLVLRAEVHLGLSQSRPAARPAGTGAEAVESLYTERRLTNERYNSGVWRPCVRPSIARGSKATGGGDFDAALRAQGIEPRPFPMAEALAGAGETEAALAELCARSVVCPDVDTFLLRPRKPGLRQPYDPRFVAIYARFGLWTPAGCRICEQSPSLSSRR